MARQLQGERYKAYYSAAETAVPVRWYKNKNK